MSSDKTPWFVLRSPELGGSFWECCKTCKEKGVLDKKTKELLKLTLSSVLRRSQSTEEHIQSALDAGATKEEITEAFLIAAVEGAGTQLTWIEGISIKYLA
jgi:alkylhydroperoxidase/carboxymuconolactone decarboxylase family protein YurZ